MNKIDGIFVIAQVENIFKLCDHFSYDVLRKKLRLVGFNLQQDHIIQALITRISFKTSLYTGNILKILRLFLVWTSQQTLLGIYSVYFWCYEVTKDNEVVSNKQINEITTLINDVNNYSYLIFNIW